MNDEQNEPQRRMSENIWGWKFSFISLVIIVIGFLFLVFVGPNEEGPVNGEKKRIEHSDSIKIND